MTVQIYTLFPNPPNNRLIIFHFAVNFTFKLTGLVLVSLLWAQTEKLLLRFNIF